MLLRAGYAETCCCTALDGVGGLSGTDIGTAGAVAVPRWSLDAGNAPHTCHMRRCHPCRAALKRAAAWYGCGAVSVQATRHYDDSLALHLLQQLRKQRGLRAQPRRTSVLLNNGNVARATVDAVRVHY